MKVAAWQAPLLGSSADEVLALIRRRVDECEALGVAILCCPEAVVGGLADYTRDPFRTAIPSSDILSCLAPVADARLTTIVGFSELSSDGWLYNSAAVVSRGRLAGVYRKRHPAIRRSVYRAGKDSPVFQVDGGCFGILIMGLIDWSGGDLGDPRYDIALALATEPEIHLRDEEVVAVFDGYQGTRIDAATMRWFISLYEFF